MKLGEIASRLGHEVIGKEDIEITGVATIESAGETQLTFLSNIKYKKYLAVTKAAAVITDKTKNLLEGQSGIISDNPYLTFARALTLFHKPVEPFKEIHSTAVVDPSVEMGSGVVIGPYSVIAGRVKIGSGVTIHSHCQIYPDVEIGDGSLIYSHCAIREGSRIGAGVILQNNVTIGGDGFGYARKSDGSWYKIPQTGVVIIEDEVEIGAGSTIDRATIGSTVIGRGTKIDNLVHIGHGSIVGQNTLLCAQVGLAGSTQVGNEVILGGQVGAAGHLKIGDRVMATAQSGIPASVEAGKIISGSPAIDHRAWLKYCAVYAQTAEVFKEVRVLREQLNELLNEKHQPRNDRQIS
ncbi:MAG: UDP-3-O-(3-hydroxymyristoyl)glucosamine N-acyltransferase [Acidobacteria bacterium]|nr:UDP-3-O-(3-hydroxymyristoyl)glucosamine N-acyltransferase [Acidobacteriota bacterium]